MLVTVAEPMTDDADFTPVGVHPGCEATHPYIAIGALSPSNCLGVGYRILASLVGPPDKILISIPGLQVCSAVSLVEIPLPVWTSHHGVQAVIMIPAIESAEDILPFVDLRIELQVPVNIGIHNKMGRLRHHNLIAEHTDPQRSNQLRVLYEDM